MFRGSAPSDLVKNSTHAYSTEVDFAVLSFKLASAPNALPPNQLSCERLMKTNLPLLILTIILLAAQSASADLIIIEDAAYNRLYSTRKTVSELIRTVHALNVGTKATNGWICMRVSLSNDAEQVLRSAYCRLLDFSDGRARHSLYNVDVYANRVAQLLIFWLVILKSERS